MEDSRVPDMSNREALLVHIEGLQSVLTKRNARIVELETQLTGGVGSSTVQRALVKEYRRGWRECAHRLMETSRTAAYALRDVRSDAYKIYLEGDSVSNNMEEGK